MDLTPLAVPSTLRRLTPLLPSPPASVLEVGCGRGALAAELLRRGYDVTGVDPDPDAVRRARMRGVTVIATPLEEVDAGRYDVVLFTRSLHHVQDLDRTLDAAAARLEPGGTVVLEEFASEGVTSEAAAFVYDTLAVLAAAGVAETQGPDHGDPLQQWQHERAHLHPRTAMLEALRRRTDVGEPVPTETLWRMAAARLTGPDPARATAIARRLAEAEIRRITAGELPALGFVVAGHTKSAAGHT